MSSYEMSAAAAAFAAAAAAAYTPAPTFTSTTSTLPTPSTHTGYAMETDYPVEDYPVEDYPMEAPVTASQEFAAQAAKPSYEELEHAYNLLQGQCQALCDEKNYIHQQAMMEISRLSQAAKVQEAPLNKAKKIIKGLTSDRTRLRVDNKRLKLRVAKLEQSYGVMAVDMDIGAEAQCEILETKNWCLENELKTLQREYMELVEKSEEEQKSASAMLSKVRDQVIKDAVSRVATAKEELEKKAASQAAAAEEEMQKKAKGLKKELHKELQDKYSAAYRDNCLRFEVECRKRYEKKLALAQHEFSDRLLCQNLRPLTPSSPSTIATPSPPCSTTPSTPPHSTPLSTPPTTTSPDTPDTPETPTPMCRKAVHPKEGRNAMAAALALAQQKHDAVQGAATAALQKRISESGLEHTSPEPRSSMAALEAAHRRHERVRESAVNTLRELGEVEDQLKDVLSQRRRQERLGGKREARKGAKPMKASRQ